MTYVEIPLCGFLWNVFVLSIFTGVLVDLTSMPKCVCFFQNCPKEGSIRFFNSIHFVVVSLVGLDVWSFLMDMAKSLIVHSNFAF